MVGAMDGAHEIPEVCCHRAKPCAITWRAMNAVSRFFYFYFYWPEPVAVDGLLST
jgi:hypothetical protein